MGQADLLWRGAIGEGNEKSERVTVRREGVLCDEVRKQWTLTFLRTAGGSDSKSSDMVEEYREIDKIGIRERTSVQV